MPSREDELTADIPIASFCQRYACRLFRQDSQVIGLSAIGRCHDAPPARDIRMRRGQLAPGLFANAATQEMIFHKMSCLDGGTI